MTIDRYPFQFEIAQFGTRLGTRLEGRTAREALLRALRAVREPGFLLVSLAGLDVLSGSFSDEIIAIPYARICAGEYGNRSMVIDSPNIEIADDLAHKLERRGLAMIILTSASMHTQSLPGSDREWTVLGPLAAPMRETLNRIVALGRTSAGQLAVDLGIQHNTCLHRVNRLAALRLIHRRRVGAAGPYSTYALLSLFSDQDDHESVSSRPA
ncbi:hypothetical protein JW848_09515 [Candidatus Bipolaricaulota bacterium]|nr:hypothetical protein [Candidatus Bipolaricaulota bacterium]